MRRRLFSLAAALSLLLCLASVAAWVRAGRTRDHVWYQRSEVLQWHWSNTREGVRFCSTRLDRTDTTPAGTWWRSSWSEAEWKHAALEPPGHARLGFRWGRGEFLLVDFVPAADVSPGDAPPQKTLTAWRAHMTVVIVPHWALVAASAVLPLWWVVRRWRTRVFRRPGHCRGCGYDLRASTGRCPECGRVAPTTAAMQTS